MSYSFTLPGAPAGLVAQINARRARIPAGMRMSATPPEPAPTPPPDRPAGVSEDEWGALGDPGKRAIQRERERAEKAERDLAAARLAAKPKADHEQGPKGGDSTKGDGQKTPEHVDVASIIAQAVSEAVKPFALAQEQREAQEAAGRVVDAVREAAKPRLFDASDAIAHLQLADLTDGAGAPDQAKIAAALDQLVQAKPHLAKPADTRRQYDPANPLGGNTTPPSLDTRVKDSLSRMQAAVGIKLAGQTT